MIVIFLKILILTLSITYIWQHSGFVTDMAKIIYEKTHSGEIWMGQPLRKPFGCYVCMTFWTSFIILLFNISILYALGMACLYSILAVIFDKIFKHIFIIINKF